MQLTLHPNAASTFNSTIENLKLSMAFEPMTEPKKPVIQDPNVFVSKTINEDETIGGFQIFETDEDGEPLYRQFRVGERNVGLYGEDYIDLRRLSEAIQKAIRPSGSITVLSIEKLVFEWLKHSYFGEEVPTLSAFVLEESSKKVVEGEIWIPISSFHIEKPFKLGKVEFRLFTKEFMDRYENHFLSLARDPEEEKHIREFMREKRVKIQNTAAATVSIAAEPEIAFERAIFEADRSLVALRFFSSFSLDPTSICYSAPIERQHRDGDEYLIMKDNLPYLEYSGFSDKDLNPWTKSSSELQEDWVGGLSVLDHLLNQSNLTDFQQGLLDGLSMYSKSALSKSVTDRLMYLCIALESVFLRDRSESIQDNLATRIAFMQPVDVIKRREIVSNVKDVYKMRSGFVHHGDSVSIDDLEKLRTFWWNAWMAFLYLIPHAAKNLTKNQFFDELENRKLGG